MATITLDLPPEVFSALRRTPDEFVRELRIVGAIYWYSRGEISQEKAAQIAGMNRVVFLDELARRKIDVFVVDPTDLQRESDRG